MSDIIGTFRGTYWLKFLRIAMTGTFDLTPCPIFQYTQDKDDPLIYVLPDRWITGTSKGETDMGSVPPEFQSQVSPLESPRGYPLHDSAFSNHGWWESYDQGQTWVYVGKTEDEVNDMLFDWAEADGVDWWDREEMYEGVQLGGTKLWNSHVGPFPVDPTPVALLS